MPSPTRFSDTGYIPFQRVHPETKLRTHVSLLHIFSLAERVHGLHPHPCHSKVLAKYTSCLASFDTSVSDLGGSSVAMHPRQLKLRLGAGSPGEGGIADDVPEGLSRYSMTQRWFSRISSIARCMTCAGESSVPFRLILFDGFPGVSSVAVLDPGRSVAYRFVWSRMILILTKPLRSSFFDRNWAMLGRAFDASRNGCRFYLMHKEVTALVLVRLF